MNDYDPNYVHKKTFFVVGQKAVIVNTSNQILLLKRSDKVDSSGKWNLPGGALEENETPEESIIREVLEETGLKIEKPDLITLTTLKNEDNVLMVCYLIRVNSEEVIINWEHSEFRWVDKDEADEMDITSVTRKFINVYE